MADTFSQIYIHVIFAVKGRENQINQFWEEELYKYISGTVKNKDQKLIAINGMPDHIHLLLGLKPSCCLSNLVREIKKSSDNFIKEKKFTKSKFQWQQGFGAFSSNHSGLGNIINYINNQKNHHTKQSFRDEYTKFLTLFKVEFQPEHLFD